MTKKLSPKEKLVNRIIKFWSKTDDSKYYDSNLSFLESQGIDQLKDICRVWGLSPEV
jgi:hypothetical protein